MHRVPDANDDQLGKRFVERNQPSDLREPTKDQIAIGRIEGGIRLV
jgi:hypothetical protein